MQKENTINYKTRTHFSIRLFGINGLIIWSLFIIIMEKYAVLTLRTRLGLHSAVSPRVLVVGGGRVRAVISVGFCRVISSGSVYTRVLILVGIERLPVRGGAGRAVAVRDSSGRTVVARIRGGGLG